MKKLSLTQWCQIYLLLALLAAAIMSPILYSLLALGLLLVMLFTTFRPLPPGLNILIVMVTIFFIPLALEPTLTYLLQSTAPSFIPQLLAAASIVPAIYLLDQILKQNAQDITPNDDIRGRGITYITRSVAIATLMLVLISLMVDHSALLFTSITMALYWIISLARAFQAIPEEPVNIPSLQKRLVTGSTAVVPLFATNLTRVTLHCQLNPADPWSTISPRKITLNGTAVELKLTVTPPLAGPSLPRIKVSAIDCRGLIQVNQIAQPLELHVIPRAQYAEWLAMKYLGQAGTGADAITSLPEGLLIPKRGIEYYSTRAFQFGDALSDIDWKHTLKLKRVMIKEYIDAGKQAAVIAVNLAVSDAVEADKIAFNLITTALTLARQSIPTALVAYNQESVILTTAVTDPKQILKQTMWLVREVKPVELTHRCLQPEAIGKLRRNMTHLRSATSEPAQRLLNILDFKQQAMEQVARNHIATTALSQAIQSAPPPALIVLVSQMNHDAEALVVTTDKLTRKGYSTLRIEEEVRT